LIFFEKLKTQDQLWNLIETWLGIQQSVVDQAIHKWWVCLNACVKAKGTHFEHMLWCAVPQLTIDKFVIKLILQVFCFTTFNQ